MDNKIPNQQIGLWIDSLVNTLGVKEYAPREQYIKLFQQGETQKCIESIADYLGLPIKIELTFIPRWSISTSRSGERFRSTNIVQADSNGQGNHGITAQVTIPSWLPAYGSPTLKDIRIRVKVSDDCQSQPDSFVAIMAHELSHILLGTLSHPEKDNEFFTDLTPIVLGFGSIIGRGREVSETTVSGNIRTTHTTKYGYLTDDQFAFARNKIDGLLVSYANRKNNLLKKLTVTKQHLKVLQRKRAEFKESLSLLDKNTSRRIKANDGEQIVRMHQTGYLDQCVKISTKCEGFLSKAEPQIKQIILHTKNTHLIIKKVEDELTILEKELASLLKGLAYDLKILRRNSPFFHRMKFLFAAWYNPAAPTKLE